MFDMLDHNEADAIITLDSHSYRKNYIIAQEAPLTMHFVTNTNSKYAGLQGLKIQDIVSEPFILTEYSQGYRRVFDKELEKKSLDITPILKIGRMDIITHVLAESNIISYLPDFVTQGSVDAGKLRYLDVVDMNIDIWKQLIYHKNRWMSKSLKTFINYLKENEFQN